MSENTALDQVVQQNYVEGGAPIQKEKDVLPSTGKVDPLFLAYFYLMEASNTSAQCAVIHSKQLNQNALSQQRMNDQAAGLQWYYLPKEQVNHHSKIISHNHWHWSFWNGGFHYKTYHKTTWQTIKNADAVNQAQAKNQQVSSERQVLTDKLAVLQQLAQVSEANVNSISDEAMQSIQEGSNLLHVLESLTFQALLSQKPN